MYIYIKFQDRQTAGEEVGRGRRGNDRVFHCGFILSDSPLLKLLSAGPYTGGGRRTEKIEGGQVLDMLLTEKRVSDKLQGHYKHKSAMSVAFFYGDAFSMGTTITPENLQD